MTRSYLDLAKDLQSKSIFSDSDVSARANEVVNSEEMRLAHGLVSDAFADFAEQSDPEKLIDLGILIGQMSIVYDLVHDEQRLREICNYFEKLLLKLNTYQAPRLIHVLQFASFAFARCKEKNTIIEPTLQKLLALQAASNCPPSEIGHTLTELVGVQFRTGHIQKATDSALKALRTFLSLPTLRFSDIASVGLPRELPAKDLSDIRWCVAVATHGCTDPILRQELATVLQVYQQSRSGTNSDRVSQLEDEAQIYQQKLFSLVPPKELQSIEDSRKQLHDQATELKAVLGELIRIQTELLAVTPSPSSVHGDLVWYQLLYRKLEAGSTETGFEPQH